MKIYQIDKKRKVSSGSRIVPAEVSGLKKAAGGEDMVILTAEAIQSWRRDSYAKSREHELVELALLHINDQSPELENLDSDPEFMKAEKLALLAELVIRVVPAGKSGNIYERVSEFVVDQLTGRQ